MDLQKKGYSYDLLEYELGDMFIIPNKNSMCWCYVKVYGKGGDIALCNKRYGIYNLSANKRWMKSLMVNY